MSDQSDELTISAPDERFSYPLQIPVRFQRRTLVAHIPVIAAVAAQSFGLCADQLRVHDLGKVMIRFAEVRQQLLVAMSLGMLGDGTADQVKAEALGAVVGIQLDFPAVQPLTLGLMCLLHPDEIPVGTFKQFIRPLPLIAINELSEEPQLVHSSMLDGKQCLAVQPMVTGLIEGKDRISLS